MATSLELQHFAVLSVSFWHYPLSIKLVCITNNPCHLTCYYTDKEPVRHATSRISRGLALPWGAYWCFVAWNTLEQQEDGDTLTHTFHFPTWPICDIATPSPEPSLVTLTRKVTSENDECRVWWSGTQWKYDFAHHETIPGYIVSDIYAAGYAMIFRNLNIPKYTIIDLARIRFITSGETTNPDIKTHISTEDTVNPLSFFNISNYLARSHTPSPILWDDIEPWYVNQTYHSPDIATQIQPVVSRPDWEPGKAICLFWEDHDDRSTHIDYTTRMADTYHHDSERCPQLIIEYHTPPLPPILKSTPARWFTFRGTVDNQLSPSVAALMSHCHPGGTPLQYFEFYVDPKQTYSSIYEPRRSGQTFTPTQTHLLTKVYTLMTRATNTYPNLYLEIKEAPNDIPTGPILSSGYTVWAVIPDGAVPAWVETPMSQFIPKANTKYAIIARTSHVGAGILRWWRRYTNATYPRGIRIYSTDAGATWSKFPLQDFLFQEWGIPPKGET